MTTGKKIIGLDVGGSHVTAAIFDTGDIDAPLQHLVKCGLNSKDTASQIIATIGECIKQILIRGKNY